MQRSTIKVVLTLFVTASLLLVLAPMASSQVINQQGMADKGGKAWNISEAYSSIKVTGMTNDSVTYQIIGHAMKDKDGKVAIQNMTKPMYIQYFFANDTAIIPMDGAWGNKSHMDGAWGNKTPGYKLPGNKSMDNRTAGNRSEWKHHKGMVDYNNATINVAGANAVLAMKNITVLRHDKGGFEMQYTDIAVYLPDGTAKTYKLSKPVKITASKDKKTVTMTGSPEFRADLMDALKGALMFPANAAPLPLKTIDAKI